MSLMPMSEEVRRLHKRLKRLPPACISGFRADPREPPGRGFWCPTAFWLTCRCGKGQDIGRILGHPLGDYNPACAEPVQFVSPLGFKCSGCGRITEVIDTGWHGYNGMSGSSAVFRGKGRRRAFRRPKCDREKLSLMVTFAYREGIFQVMKKEPAKKIKDYFDGFQAHAFCGDCCQIVFVAGFDV